MRDFTYDEYGRIIDLLREGRKNVCFRDFAHHARPERFFILRHDVDYSLGKALEMARFEAARSIRATYFMLLSCDYYNLLSETSCHVPKLLCSMGHEVGLHYDVRAMAKRGDPPKQLMEETRILSNLSGDAVHSIAMHNPSLYGDDPFAADTRFVNAYHHRFTKEAAYFSDSCGAWRNNAYEAFSTGNLPPCVQLLIHPVFWGTSAGDRWARLQAWSDEKRAELTATEQSVRAIWEAHSGVKEHDARA